MQIYHLAEPEPVEGEGEIKIGKRWSENRLLDVCVYQWQQINLFVGFH